MGCDECNHEMPEEKLCNDGQDYKWVYHCSLNDYRRIERDEGEAAPDWCPLLKGEE